MHGAKVYVAGRDAGKAATTIAALAAETGKTARFLRLDLGNLQSVKAAAAELAAQEPAVHLLFNNAWVLLNSSAVHGF
jgi:retinol dehydrogenase-12